MQDILIVDDESYLQELFAFELMDSNYTIIGAENIEKARVYLDRFKLDLVILDLYINGFYGLDLLEEIKQKEPALPVFIVTAYDNQMDDQRARKAEAYIIKDFKTIGLMSQKVRDLLG